MNQDQSLPQSTRPARRNFGELARAKRLRRSRRQSFRVPVGSPIIAAKRALLPTTKGEVMSHLPSSTTKLLQFEHGTALGVSNLWVGGQYCSIFTQAGIVGCGIYSISTPAEFGQAIAIAKGTPENPLTDPEDLFDAKIVDCTPRAKELGIEVGMTGREAVERMLQAST